MTLEAALEVMTLEAALEETQETSQEQLMTDLMILVTLVEMTSG